MPRPTKFDPNKDYLSVAKEYIATCGREQTKLPKLSEFAREYLGIDDETLLIWGHKYPKLSATVKKIKDAQAEQLMDDGLYGGKEVNNAMAIFLLKANHGLIETSRIEHEGNITESLNINVITYGQQDPLFTYLSSQLRSNQFKSTGTAGNAGSTQISSTQLAQESKKDNAGDKPAN